MAISKEDRQFMKLAMDKDASLIPKALSMSDLLKRTPNRDVCPACVVLKQLSPEGDVVCKICGRDDEMGQ